ncbi:MAG: hypothetical protein QOI80_758, partial [Solirubrobacteraceae bacterium]|nr:hypothetical protein [Solirubrobacteraceae bacterium]
GVRFALATGRPIPEDARERFFLGLHGRAERAYHERLYPGELLTVYGEGLYEDPELGWGPFAERVVTRAVPGDHIDNRQLMAPPHVGAVADLLRSHLDGRLDHAAATSA